jgi:hypothetical protein
MKPTTIMSHYDDYRLIIMTDNDVTPTELFTHFLNESDTSRVIIEYEKDDCESLVLKNVTVKGDNGYYFDINYDRFNELNNSHFLSISW